jgi:outer membrane protein
MGKKLAIITGVLLAISAVLAQDKVAFVDSDKILTDFEDARIARASLDQSVFQWKFELDSLRRAYQKAEEEFKAQQPMLSEEALRARQQELEALRKQYETFGQDIWGEGGKVEQKHKELFATVIDKMNEVIEQIAEEQGVSIVLDVAAGSILYADLSLDLTSEVIEELNREYAAIAPDVERKVAIFGVAALDERSQSEELGQRVRDYVRRIVSEFEQELRLELIEEYLIEQRLQQYGGSFDRELEDKTALEIGLTLDAEFVYVGTVEKQAGEIVVTLKLLKPKEDKVFPEVVDRIAEKEDALLEQRVAVLVAKLQAYLIAETE